LAKVIYSTAALDDLLRLGEHVIEHSPSNASDMLAKVHAAVAILADHPEIGRRADALRRELVISRGAAGYVALYRFDPRSDVVRILRIRHRREAGYRG
jgi:plasmid stabilization system protein ParE